MYLSSNSLLQGGKYKIIRFLSSGGFGNTYEAIHTMMDIHVAIKEFFPKMFCDRDQNTSHVTVATQGNQELVEKLRAKFTKEAQAVYNMKHKNIVRVLDIFEENGTAYYVMEYIDGKSLNDITKERGALPEAEAVGYIRQVADALKYVHSLNRLHLDIKPGNIMVDKNGKAILIDFGASKHYDMESGENTSTLMGLNTKGYAPIEQSTRSFTTFSPATDVYALGATLYKLLTGIVPPDANLLMAEEETLASLPSKISDKTRAAVEAAMQLRRKDRPQSVDELILILDNSVKTVSKPIKETKEQTNNQSEEDTLFDTPASEKNTSNKDNAPKSSVKQNSTNDNNDSLKQKRISTQKKSKSKSKWFVAFMVGVISVVGFGIYRCSTPFTASLDSETDSLCYAVGVLNAEGIREYVCQNMNVDTLNCMGNFEDGVKDALDSSDDSDKSALYAGYLLGYQIVEPMTKNLNEHFFKEDSSNSVDMSVMLKGMKDAVLTPSSVSMELSNHMLDSLSADKSILSSNIEKVSYHCGVLQSQGMEEYLIKQLGVDSLSIPSVFDGIDKTIEKFNDSNHIAYCAGLSIGQQLPSIMNEVQTGFFKDDESSFSSKAFLAGFMDVAMARQLKISRYDCSTLVYGETALINYEIGEATKLAKTQKASNEIEKMLLGKHMFSSQWISWNYFGNAVITKTDTPNVYNIVGLQDGSTCSDEEKGRQNGDYLTIKGTITAINKSELVFNGQIVLKVYHLNSGQPCTRNGEFHFKATGSRKYWRMQEMTNPCDGVCDYVDIYFKQTAQKKSSNTSTQTESESVEPSSNNAGGYGSSSERYQSSQVGFSDNTTSGSNYRSSQVGFSNSSSQSSTSSAPQTYGKDPELIDLNTIQR